MYHAPVSISVFLWFLFSSILYADIAVTLTFSQTGPFEDCCSTNTYYVVDLEQLESMVADINNMFGDAFVLVDEADSMLQNALSSIDSCRTFANSALSGVREYLRVSTDPNASDLYYVMDDINFLLDSVDDLYYQILDARSMIDEIESTLSTPQVISADEQVLAYACTPNPGESGGGSSGSCPCPPYIQAIHDYLANDIRPLLSSSNTHLSNIYSELASMHLLLQGWDSRFASWGVYFADWAAKFGVWSNRFEGWSNRLKAIIDYYDLIGDAGFAGIGQFFLIPPNAVQSCIFRSVIALYSI